MKKNIVLSFILLFCCYLNLSAVVIPRFGSVMWNSSGSVASGLLQIPMDFDYNDNPQIYDGAYFKLFLAQDVVYEIEIYHYAWFANGAPSSFDIVYPNGKTTTIYIPDSPTVLAKGGKGEPAVITKNE